MTRVVTRTYGVTYDDLITNKEVHCDIADGWHDNAFDELLYVTWLKQIHILTLQQHQ